MKSIYLFCSNPLVYLTELPVILMLFITIQYHDSSKDIFKFYPLEIFLSLAILFIAVYFFRVISISYDEIRIHGLFSSKDRAFIEENSTLVLTLFPGMKMRTELYGGLGDEPVFDWMKKEVEIQRDICYFRGKAMGGKGTAQRILRYFGLEAEDAALAMNDGYSGDFKLAKVDCAQKNEVFEIKIKIKETVI